MLLTIVTESNPIYQFCEACIDNYIRTENEDWINLLTEEMTDSQMMAAMKKVTDNTSNPNFEERPNTFGELLSDVYNRHPTNPLAAVKDLMMIGDFPSRAKQIDVHQPQGRYIRSMGFWMHKNTPTMLNAIIGGGVGLAALHKIHEYRNKPKTVIAQKIASLRKILNKFKSKIAGSKSEQEKSILKKVCAKIIGAIDKLLGFAQRKTDKYFAD